jgi:hypothetical protein
MLEKLQNLKEKTYSKLNEATSKFPECQSFNILKEAIDDCDAARRREDGGRDNIQFEFADLGNQNDKLFRSTPTMNEVDYQNQENVDMYISSPVMNQFNDGETNNIADIQTTIQFDDDVNIVSLADGIQSEGNKKEGEDKTDEEEHEGVNAEETENLNQIVGNIIQGTTADQGELKFENDDELSQSWYDRELVKMMISFENGN